MVHGVDKSDQYGFLVMRTETYSALIYGFVFILASMSSLRSVFVPFFIKKKGERNSLRKQIGLDLSDVHR